MRVREGRMRNKFDFGAAYVFFWGGRTYLVDDTCPLSGANVDA